MSGRMGGMACLFGRLELGTLVHMELHVEHQ